MCVLGAGIENDGLDVAQLFVGFRHVAFVFKITDTTHAAQDELRFLLLGKINSQAVVDRHAYTRIVFEDLTDGFLAFADGEGLPFGTVTADTDDDLVEDSQTTLDDVVMADSEGVK